MRSFVNEHWKTEDFEDLVSRSLIAMYESKIHKECFKVPPFIKPSENDISFVRNIGPYFPPSDREIQYGSIDIVNDGLPKEACWAYDPTESFMGKKKEDLIFDEYFRLGYLRKMNNPPPGLLNYKYLKYFGDHTIYQLLLYSATQTKGLHLQKSYITLDKNGMPYDTFGRHPSDGKLINLAIGSIEDEEGDITTDFGWISAILGFYQDRRYLWNVTANEGIAKATFGVYPEEVKSLFYAREMPMTETGRKRPMLHWVAAHQRRIKSGIEIDIEKHLRGINEFVYNGTKFTITRPLKNTG